MRHTLYPNTEVARFRLTNEAAHKIRAAGHRIRAPEVHNMPLPGQDSFQMAVGYLNATYPGANLTDRDIRVVG